MRPLDVALIAALFLLTLVLAAEIVTTTDAIGRLRRKVATHTALLRDLDGWRTEQQRLGEPVRTRPGWSVERLAEMREDRTQLEQQGPPTAPPALPWRGER